MIWCIIYILQYAKHHHHPYIDSTTMLSDNSDVLVCSTPPPKLAKLSDVLHATVCCILYA